MKMLLPLMIFLTPLASQAEFDIKPGLWEVSTVITVDGTTVDPQAEIRKVMAGLSPEQKKQMEQYMGKAAGAGLNLNENGLQTCYSKDMIKNPEKLTENKDCKTTITTQSPKKLTGTFNCPASKTSGTFDWTSKSNTNFAGVMTGKTGDGKSSVIRYEGKFLKADCGNVKPLL